MSNFSRQRRKTIVIRYLLLWASLVVQTVNNLPAMQETQVWSLGWEYLLEKEMATHSSILACRILWTDKPGGLQSMGFQSWTWLKQLSTYNIFKIWRICINWKRLSCAMVKNILQISMANHSLIFIHSIRVNHASGWLSRAAVFHVLAQY